MLSAKLVVVGGDMKTTEIQLRLPAIIGRGKGSTIALLQPLVSRQHCELFEANGRLRVRDLGSLNGTYVNNEKVSESEIPPNELLTVGTVTFRAIYEPIGDEASPATSAPQYAPSKPRPDDEQPTIRVDVLGGAEPVAAYAKMGEVEQADDEEGVPSTPLFAVEPTRPAPASQRPTVVGTRPVPPVRPAGPVAIPTVVTTDAVKPGPVPAAPVQEAQAAPAEEEDDDLNDFLKSLGKK